MMIELGLNVELSTVILTKLRFLNVQLLFFLSIFSKFDMRNDANTCQNTPFQFRGAASFFIKAVFTSIGIFFFCF